MLRLGVILVGLLGTFSTLGGAATNDVLLAGVAEFNAAYKAWDGDRFAAAVRLCERATTNAPAQAVNFYWLGAAQFHRMLQAQTASTHPANEAVAQAALNAAVEALGTAVKLDEGHAESHALIGTLYGMKINGSLFRAARFGPRVVKHQDLALSRGANNPRVHYLLGMCQFHTANKPAEFQAALQTLLKAEALFEAEAKRPPAPLDPRWGYDSCLTFIGRSREQLGQRKEAADYFRRALAIHPTDRLAKEGLARVSENSEAK